MAGVSRGITALCACDCGQQHRAAAYMLVYGQVRSCGCLQRDTARRTCLDRNGTHGMAGTRFHKTWKQMKKRGTNPSRPDRAWYGPNGVGLHEPWLSFESFRQDMHAGYLEHARRFGEDDTTIDRISNADGYYPHNVRWATRKEQSRNQTRVPRFEYRGESRTLAEWSEIVGIAASTLKARVYMGWSVERMLTERVTPSKRGIWVSPGRVSRSAASDKD